MLYNVYALLYTYGIFKHSNGCKLLINVNGINFCICELYTCCIGTVMIFLKNISKQHQSVI